MKKSKTVRSSSSISAKMVQLNNPIFSPLIRVSSRPQHFIRRTLRVYGTRSKSNSQQSAMPLLSYSTHHTYKKEKESKSSNNMLSLGTVRFFGRGVKTERRGMVLWLQIQYTYTLQYQMYWVLYSSSNSHDTGNQLKEVWELIMLDKIMQVCMCSHMCSSPFWGSLLPVSYR